MLVDWNNDNDYLDADEFYDLGAHVGNLSSTVLIPDSINIGTYTFAVLTVFDNVAFGTPITQTNYCTAAFFTGEMEEYTLNVIPVSDCLPSINISSDTIDEGTFLQTLGFINLNTNVIAEAGDPIILQAQDSILIYPLFETESGSELELLIDTCY